MMRASPPSIGLFARRVALWTALLAATPSEAAETIDVTVYADDSYPPYSYHESGEARGIYTEIIRRAFARMPGYRIRIEAIPWKRALVLIESGQAFALYPPYYHPRERPYMGPYSTPILEEKVVVFCRDEILTRPRPNWPGDYFGLRIGANRGYRLGGDAFWAAVANGKIVYEEAGGNRQNIQKLLLGRLDCYLNDRVSVLWEYGRMRRDEALPGDHPGALVEGAPVSSEHGHLAVTTMDKGRFPFKDKFLVEFNAIIRHMQAQGEIARIVDDHIGR